MGIQMALKLLHRESTIVKSWDSTWQEIAEVTSWYWSTSRLCPMVRVVREFTNLRRPCDDDKWIVSSTHVARSDLPGQARAALEQNLGFSRLKL